MAKVKKAIAAVDDGVIKISKGIILTVESRRKNQLRSN